MRRVVLIRVLRSESPVGCEGRPDALGESLPRRTMCPFSTMEREKRKRSAVRPGSFLHANHGSGLRAHSVVSGGYRLISIGERLRHNHVELKLARGDQSRKRDGRWNPADLHRRQRGQCPGLRARSTYYGIRGGSEAVGIEHDRLAGFGWSRRAWIEACRAEQCAIGVRRREVWSAGEDKERRR